MEGQSSRTKMLELVFHENEDVGMHFCLLIQHDNNKKLPIPEKMMKHIGEKWCDSANLRGPSGRIWNVGVCVDEKEGLFFSSRWDKFYDENNLSMNEFLLFKYVGNMNFDVRIFGTDRLMKFCDHHNNNALLISDDERKHHKIQSATSPLRRRRSIDINAIPLLSDDDSSSDANSKQLVSLSANCTKKRLLTYRRRRDIVKDYEAGIYNLDVSQPFFVDENALVEVKITEDNTSIGAIKKENIINVDDTNNIVDVFVDDMDFEINNDDNNNNNNEHSKEERLNAWARSNMFTSTKPFFKISLTAHSVNKFHLVIPSVACDSRLLPSKEGKIVLRNLEHKVWIVKIVPTEEGHSLKKGWRRFAVENSLKEGDVCVFESMYPNEFMVHVFT